MREYDEAHPTSGPKTTVHTLLALVPAGSDCGRHSHGVLIPHAAGLLLVHAAPLLEEERHGLLLALVADRERPLGLHRPRAGSGLAPDDGPVDVRQVKTSCVREQGLERDKARAGGDIVQMLDSIGVVRALDTHADAGAGADRCRGHRDCREAEPVT